jgi:hypothetical protein
MKMELLQSSLDILVSNACVSSYLDVTSCKGYANYRSPELVVAKDPAELDDSREEDEQARKGNDSMDDTERSRHGEESNKFSLPAFLLPLLPFSYLSENNVSEDIFRTRQLPIETRDKEVSNNTRLCRCHAWSQDSENQVSEVSTHVRSYHSEVCVLHWDEVVDENMAIDYQRLQL